MLREGVGGFVQGFHAFDCWGDGVGAGRFVQGFLAIGAWVDGL